MASSSEDTDMLKLVANDGKEFQVKKVIAAQMQFFKDMLEDVDNPEDKVISLSEIDGTTLARVIDFCTFYHENPMCTGNAEKIARYHRDFLHIPHHLLFRLVNAANFLNMEPLCDLLCKCIAEQMTGKTLQEIRSHFAKTEEFMNGIEGEYD